MKSMRLHCAVLLVTVLSACGGGGGDAGSSSFGGTSGTGTSTTVTTVPAAAAITLDLGGVSSITNNGSDTVTATVTAKTASNVVLANVPVSISSDSGDVVVASAVTNAQGKLSATISLGGDRSNRTINITATSASLSQSRSFLVTGSRIRATAVPSVLPPSTNGEVQYQIVDVNGNPMARQTISVTSTAGNVSAVTDTNGVYTYSYVAPAIAGNLVISATAAGVTQQETVTVQPLTGATKPNVPAGTILSASVEANPSVVVVNTAGSTTNRSAVRALFVGANNASIPNVRVRFDLATDLNSVGGSFTSGTSIVYSTTIGEASTFYVPATKSSPTNGVTIRACYGYTDADLDGGACPNSVSTALTVASGAVSVTIGTNNRLIELNNSLQLAQDFVVTVNDAAGRAANGIDIVPSVDLVSFGKGRWIHDGQWVLAATQYFEDSNGAAIADGAKKITTTITDPDGTQRTLITVGGGCWNEDRNRNGIKEDAEDARTKVVNGLTQSVYTEFEGGNGNGTLEPRKADVVITINGGVSAKTDATGSAVVRITYPRNVAGWLKFKILVSAGGISGTEGRATWVNVLGVPIADIQAAAEPAFVTSPYGINEGCDDPN